MKLWRAIWQTFTMIRGGLSNMPTHGERGRLPAMTVPTLGRMDNCASLERKYENAILTAERLLNQCYSLQCRATALVNQRRSVGLLISSAQPVQIQRAS